MCKKIYFSHSCQNEGILIFDDILKVIGGDYFFKISEFFKYISENMQLSLLFPETP